MAFGHKFWNEIKKNYSGKTVTERVFWFVVGLSLFIFGLVLGLGFAFSFLIAILVVLGIVLLSANPAAVIMTATLFFIVCTFTLQRRDFDIRNRPYLSFSNTRLYARTNNEVRILSSIVNSGNLAAFVKKYKVYIGSESSSDKAITCNFKFADKMWKNFVILPKSTHEGKISWFTLGNEDYKRYNGKYKFLCIEIGYDFIDTEKNEPRFFFWTLYALDGKTNNYWEPIESGTFEVDELFVGRKISDAVNKLISENGRV
ncbi:MAG: hypothetical protein PHE61_08745 [Candidatus Omnitrophica bacterium]|nr:hypothetical protein [Candidatus Omnitrophota bacterium]